MAETCETVIVQTKNGPVRVNKEDAHKWTEEKKEPEKRKYTRKSKD